jgi:hypothetical protein
MGDAIHPAAYFLDCSHRGFVFSFNQCWGGEGYRIQTGVCRSFFFFKGKIRRWGHERQSRAMPSKHAVAPMVARSGHRQAASIACIQAAGQSTWWCEQSRRLVDQRKEKKARFTCKWWTTTKKARARGTDRCRGSIVRLEVFSMDKGPCYLLHQSVHDVDCLKAVMHFKR